MALLCPDFVLSCRVLSRGVVGQHIEPCMGARSERGKCVTPHATNWLAKTLYSSTSISLGSRLQRVCLWMDFGDVRGP